MNRKTLVILAGLMILTMLIVVSCAQPAPEVKTVKETVVVKETVIVQAPAPAAAPKPTEAPKPTVAPSPIRAVLKVVPVPGYVSDPGAITTTVSYISDTVVGPARSTVALYTSGLNNVPVKVPVRVECVSADPKNPGKPAWTLTKPPESKATLVFTNTQQTVFTPDVVGAYQANCNLGAGFVASGVQVYAGTYVGVDKGNCKQCHALYTEEWAKTKHATLFSRELDNMFDGPLGAKPTAAGYITHYSETCARCHTTGWYPAPFTGSGGYWDAKAKANWTFPTWKQIDDAFLKKGPSNWGTAPAEVKSMGTIGCEVCHGPANEHATKGAKVMQASFDNGVCNQCHGAAANHSKGWQITNSKHTTGTSFEEIKGPARQACMRCHGAEGFVSFLANPKNQAAWMTEEGSVGCSTCHDPHNDKNPWQLRVVGKPVEVPYANAKDVGLSAICETCHNGRQDGDAFFKGTTTGYPHYSNAAEMLSDLGGVTYGATVPNSPHGMLVGNAPLASGATTPVAAKFKWSEPGDTKGNVPGPCVYCHMWDPVTAPMTATLAFKVGGHSFNTITPDGKEVYGASCKSCHGDLKDFNLKAKADYDGNGKAEGVKDEIKGLLNATWKAVEAKGFKKSNNSPYATIPADADAKSKNAWFNFRYVYGVMWGVDAAGKPLDGNQGAGAAIHNFKRSCALLQLSLKDLGALPSAAADCTK